MKFLREPLVHFIALGALLFVIFGLVGKSERIVITSTKVEELVKNFTYDNKRPPTPDEVERTIQDYIREEVLCRDAWERGIDRENTAVRRELRQKMEFFNASADTPLPTDGQLKDFLEKHPDMFRSPDGTLPQLADVRDTVQSAWVAMTQKEARDAAYQKLRSKYVVIVQRPTTAPSTKPAEAR